MSELRFEWLFESKNPYICYCVITFKWIVFISLILVGKNYSDLAQDEYICF